MSAVPQPQTWEDVGIVIPLGRSGEVDTLCPQCSHQRKKSRLKELSVNTDTQTWYCHHCGWSGALHTGSNGYGARLAGPATPPAPRVYATPKMPPQTPLPEDVQAWFAKRAIADDVVATAGISAGQEWCPQLGKETTAIRFPYFRDGELVNIKYRSFEKHFWMAKGAERILYGLDGIADAEEIAIVEGELDKLTIDTVQGPPTVSVPDGAPTAEAKHYASKFSFLDADAMARFKTARIVFIATDTDVPGEALAAELARRFGPRCVRVVWPEGCKDANDTLVKYGPDAVRAAFASARSTADDAPTPPSTPVDPHRCNLTDLGNAEFLVDAHGPDLHYSYEVGKWLAWSAKHWEFDASGAVDRLAKQSMRAWYGVAKNEPDPKRADDIAKHAHKSQSASRINAAIDLARSESGIPIALDDLDCGPWLLNVQNGILDLRTGRLSPHRRDALLSKLAPTAYDPNATCNTFLAFLDRIMGGNEELIGFLQRAAGYSLTGIISERVLFILHGCGRNGKSTLLEGFRDVLGSDYTDRTPTDLLLTRRHEGIPNDIAALRGKRFVSASEVNDGRRLDEAKVKDLTGGDTISARFMRGEFFTFRPEFKLWLGTNHKPVINGTDKGIWDRIRLIPFEVRIPDSEVDRTLSQKLRDEAEGILAWMVDGCQLWQQRGLDPPAEVLAATDTYRAEMDTLGGFITDCCEVNERAVVATKDLYAAYIAWCETSGERPISKIDLTRKLGERGYETSRTTTARGWKGIGLRGTENATALP